MSLKWKNMPYNSSEAQIGHASLSEIWDTEHSTDQDKKTGHKASVRMVYSLIKLFPTREEAQQAMEDSLRRHCQAILDELGHGK